MCDWRCSTRESGDSAQLGQVSLECGAASVGQGEPGPGPSALVLLGGMDVVGVDEDFEVLADDVVTDTESLLHGGEVDGVDLS